MVVPLVSHNSILEIMLEYMTNIPDIDIGETI